MRNSVEMTDGKPIAVSLQSTSVNLLDAFYDIQGGKGEVLFYCSVSDTTRDKEKTVH
jgi:hypothetical protein